MKTLKKYMAIFLVTLFISGSQKYMAIFLVTLFISGSMYSCLIFETHPRHDNGNHNGWYKNPHNPHHPNHHKHKGKK